MSTAMLWHVEHDGVNTDIDALARKVPDLGSVDQLARDNDTREDVPYDRNRRGPASPDSVRKSATRRIAMEGSVRWGKQSELS
jgi:hypothetical protein